MSDQPQKLKPEDFEYGPGYLEGLTKSKRARRDHEIEWHGWGDEPFDKARADGKLVLLDITAPWCHWCHVMDETTYSTPEVIEYINEKIVAVRVNADQHPEVEKAYLSGGWPTTALLLPSGETLSSLTYISPENMLKWMDEVLKVHAEQKDDIEGQVAAQRAGFAAQIETAGAVGAKMPDLDSFALRLTGEALRAFDGEHGGFGSPEQNYQPKFPQPALMEFFIARAQFAGDPSAKSMLEKTLLAMRGILDREWGGFFRYSVNRSWTVPHFEKMLGDQARLLRCYLHFYLYAGEDWAKPACDEIARYVDSWLRGDDWEFWSSQDADVGSHEDDAPFIPGEDYFGLSVEDRRSLGIPHVERDVIAGWASDMAGAYIEFGAATADAIRVEAGLKTLDGIWANMRSADGWIRRSLKRTAQDKPVLSDQIGYGRSALIAHGVTGDEKWLNRAAEIAAFVSGNFEDKRGGGFFFVPFEGKERGNLLFIGKPFEENCDAAAFFAEMYLATSDESFAESAKSALFSSAQSADKYGFLGSSYFHALHLLTSGTVFAVLHPAGAKGGETSESSFFAIASKLYGISAPGRVVRHLYAADENELAEFGGISLKAGGAALLYVCAGKTCLSPLNMDDDSFEESLRNALSGLNPNGR